MIKEPKFLGDAYPQIANPVLKDGDLLREINELKPILKFRFDEDQYQQEIEFHLSVFDAAIREMRKKNVNEKRNFWISAMKSDWIDMRKTWTLYVDTDPFLAKVREEITPKPKADWRSQTARQPWVG